jgi:hypothetical protein
MFNKKLNYEIKWYRVSEVEPPVNTNILVLVNGEIHEGYLHEHEIMVKGLVKDTTLYTNSKNYGCGSPQHLPWGDDPYWMPIPVEKPKQIKSEKVETSNVFSKKMTT